MSTRNVSRTGSDSEFLKLARLVEQLKKIGFSDQALEAMIREKIETDVARDRAKRRLASLN